MFFHLIVSLTLLLVSTASAELQHCALLGPVFPPPLHPSTSSSMKTAIESIQKSIDDAIAAGNSSYGPLDGSSTSFSVQIFSSHEEDALYTYHYNAPGLADSTDGVKTIDDNSLYRIGSVSKLFTMYIFLAAAGDRVWMEPITKFITELAEYAAQHPADENALDISDWSEVTIGALASHLGGIPIATAGDARADPGIAVYLPPAVILPIIENPIPQNISDDNCPNPLVSPCTRAAFFQSLTLAHPGLAPFHGPSYSNSAFALLALALENITSTPFTTLFKTRFTQPLNLHNTYYSNAPLSQGVVPHNDSTALYSADLIFENPAGAYYASISDLSLIGKSILNSTLLSPALTGRWMKPATFTAKPATLVGAPWEIFLAPQLPGKNSWIYSKAGHIGAYLSNFALLPDWDVGFSVLAAGDDAVRVNNIISDIVVAELVPALEAAAKSEAAIIYSGAYFNSARNETFILAIDEFPGLVITNWILNGTDMVAGFAEVGDQLRLNPSGLKSKDGKREGWRMVINQQMQVEGAFVVNCVDWDLIDAGVYGGIGLDEFGITVGEEGRAIGVESRGFRGVYERD